MKKLEKMININELGTILSKHFKIENVYVTKCTLMTDVNNEVLIMARRSREVDIFLGGGSILNIYYEVIEKKNRFIKFGRSIIKRFMKGIKNDRKKSKNN